jgi:hypothetical protein
LQHNQQAQEEEEAVARLCGYFNVIEGNLTLAEYTCVYNRRRCSIKRRKITQGCCGWSRRIKQKQKGKFETKRKNEGDKNDYSRIALPCSPYTAFYSMNFRKQGVGRSSRNPARNSLIYFSLFSCQVMATYVLIDAALIGIFRTKQASGTL